MLRDLASAGLKKIESGLDKLRQKTRGLGASGMGIGKLFGGGGGAGPGGFGGALAGLMKLTAGAALLPVRILAAFAKLIPGVGGVFSGVVGAGANILSGLVGVVANIVGSITNAFVGLVRGVARVFQRIVSIAGRILGRIVGIAAKVGLGAGVVLGYTLFKGIKDNVQLADLRAVMRKVFKGAASEYEELARRLSLTTPYTPMEAIRSVVSLGAGAVDVKEYINDVFDLAAATKGLGVRLKDVVNVFVRLKAGGFGEAFARLRESMTISRIDLEKTGGLKFNKSGAFQGTPDEAIAGVVKVIRARFGGMAKEAATVGSGPLSTLIGYFQELRRQGAEAIYEVSNALITRLNTALEKVLASQKWQQFIAWTQRASKALADGLISKVETLWEWINTRDWSWDAIKKSADEAGRKLGEAWGLFVAAAKDAVQGVLRLLAPMGKVVLAQIGVWAAQLWEIIAPHVRNVEARIFAAASRVFVRLSKMFAKESRKYKWGDPRQVMFAQLGVTTGKMAGMTGDEAAELQKKAASPKAAAEDKAAVVDARRRLANAKGELDEAFQVEASGFFDDAKKKARQARAAMPGLGDVIPERPGAREDLKRERAQSADAAEMERVRQWQRSRATRDLLGRMAQRTRAVQRYERAAEGAARPADRERIMQAAQRERDKLRELQRTYNAELKKITQDETAALKAIVSDIADFGKTVVDRTRENFGAIKELAAEVSKLKKLAKART